MAVINWFVALMLRILIVSTWLSTLAIVPGRLLILLLIELILLLDKSNLIFEWQRRI